MSASDGDEQELFCLACRKAGPAAGAERHADTCMAVFAAWPRGFDGIAVHGLALRELEVRDRERRAGLLLELARVKALEEELSGATNSA